MFLGGHRSSLRPIQCSKDCLSPYLIVRPVGHDVGSDVDLVRDMVVTAAEKEALSIDSPVESVSN